MIRKTKLITLIAMSFLLVGCNIGGNGGKDNNEPDYSSYEWGEYDLTNGKKAALKKIEDADPFYYYKEGTIFAKCTNGDIVYGKQGNIDVFSKSNGYAYYEAGEKYYKYFDYQVPCRDYYNKLGNAADLAYGKEGWNEDPVSADYNSALSHIQVELYSYYRVDQQKFTNGLFCDTYISYGPAVKSDFVITAYADETEAKCATFFNGLTPIKAKMDEYKMWRSHSAGCLIDNELKIYFKDVSFLEAKALRDAMLDVPHLDVKKDTYEDLSEDFTTKLSLPYGRSGVIHGGYEFSTSMTMSYKKGDLTFTYDYASPAAKNSKETWILLYKGECISSSENGVVTNGLLCYSQDMIPSLGQTNQNYLAANED